MTNRSAHELFEIMRRRRSIRQFRPDPIPDELIHQLVRAAGTAPSASNKQPWRFWALRDRKTIRALAGATQAVIERIAEHIEPAHETFFRSYGSYFTRFVDAPVVMIVLYRRLRLLSQCVQEYISDEDQQAINLMERDSALVSASLALQNLLLMVSELGLGASAMTGPLLAPKAIRTILGIQPSWEPLCLVPIGYPDCQPEATGRKDVQKILRIIDEQE